MSAVIITACAGGFLSAVTAVCGYIAGRRSSSEELAAAELAQQVRNAAPDRDALALPPERTGEHPVAYDWATEPDDTGPGTLAHLRSGGTFGRRLG